MNIPTDQLHTFTPSRPDGVVCVQARMAAFGPISEMCGYPAGHPIHAAPAVATPAEARTGISDRAAAALEDLATVRQQTLAMCRSLPVSWPPAEMEGRLDRIELALREPR